MTVRIEAAGLMMAALAGIVPLAAAASAQRRADGVVAAKAGDPLEAGAQAWDAQNYTRALAIWRPLAAAGNANAQYNLAQAYRLGRGVTKDNRIALDWYRRAAEQNHAHAQANYGLMLFDSGDRRGAMPWLGKAADLGDPRAQYVVGTALFNGDLLPKDWVRAYALMTRAAATGLTPARTSLAEMDRFVPLAQRTQGTAQAREMARAQLLASNEEEDDTLVRASGGAARGDAGVAAAAPVKVAAVPVTKALPAPKPVPVPAAKPQPVAKPVQAKVAAPKALSPVPVATSGAWRVQVGAFADPSAAGEVWAGIMRKAPGLGLRSMLVKAGAVTRLQAGPLASRADATKACARIKATGAACFPVAGN